MANESGPQPDVRFCPACKADLRNVPRDEMPPRKNAPPDTHTYECTSGECGERFEINQDR